MALPEIFIVILSSNTLSSQIYLLPKDIPWLTGNSQQLHISFQSAYYCKLTLFNHFQRALLCLFQKAHRYSSLFLQQGNVEMDVQFLKQSTGDAKAATVLVALFENWGTQSPWDPNWSPKDHMWLCTHHSGLQGSTEIHGFSSDPVKEALKGILV